MSQKSLILLHGALGSKSQFNRLKAELETDFDVYTFTFEGHGGVSVKGTFGIGTFTENLLAFMVEKGVEKSSLFGFSMGGYVALKFAGMHPNRVDKIVTYGTKFDWTPEFSAAEVRKLNPEKIAEKVPQFAKHLAKTHEPLDWKKVVTDTAQMMIDLGANNGSEFSCSEITAPTLVALGELDNMSTERESQEVANLLPNGRFELIPGFEHPIEKVNHSELARIINDFVLGS